MSRPPPSKLHSLLLSVYNTSTFRHSSQHQYTTRTEGGPFLEMVRESPYAGVLEDQSQSYDVYLDKSNLHWFILLRTSEPTTLPYITLEISTLNMIDLLTATRVISETETESKKLTHIGRYHGKLSTLCTTADRVCAAMGHYKLLLSNCQHFCNNLAYQFGLTIHPPTGHVFCNVPAVTVKEELKDEREVQNTEIATVVYRTSFKRTSPVVQKSVARAVAVFTGVKGYNDITTQISNKIEQLA